MNAYRFAEARKAKGISQQELAEALNSSQKQVHLYESGKRDPKAETVIKIASVLNTPVTYLLGLDANQKCQEHLIPVLARLSKSNTNTAADRYQEVGQTLYKAHKKAFWLVVKGNSMNKLFPESSLVLVDPMAKVQNGDVAAVKLKDHDATLRRIYFDDDGIRLCPESYDDGYGEVFISEADKSKDMDIVGKVVSYTAPDGWRA